MTKVTLNVLADSGSPGAKMSAVCPAWIDTWNDLLKKKKFGSDSFAFIVLENDSRQSHITSVWNFNLLQRSRRNDCDLDCFDFVIDAEAAIAFGRGSPVALEDDSDAGIGGRDGSGRVLSAEDGPVVVRDPKELVGTAGVVVQGELFEGQGDRALRLWKHQRQTLIPVEKGEKKLEIVGGKIFFWQLFPSIFYRWYHIIVPPRMLLSWWISIIADTVNITCFCACACVISFKMRSWYALCN